MEDFLRQVIAEVGRLGPWWLSLVLAIVLSVAIVGIRMGWKGLHLPPLSPYRPVDNSPGSDGSAPGDKHDGSQGNLVTDPKNPGGYPGGGGG